MILNKWRTILSWDASAVEPTPDDPSSYLGWLVYYTRRSNGTPVYGVITKIAGKKAWAYWAVTIQSAIHKFSNITPDANRSVSEGGELTYISCDRVIAIKYIGLTAEASVDQTNIALVHHPDYYNFTGNGGQGWRMDQYVPAMNDLQKGGELDDVDHVEPENVTPEDASLIHTPTYVQDVFGDVKESNHARGAWAGGRYDESAQKAILRSTGGMIKTNEEALNRGMAVQMYDMFHHAYPNHGEGFCVLNDVAISAKKLANQGKKVMIIDTDVHQGQGTAVCLQDVENTFTLSTHERANYPHPKEQSDLDVELEPGVTDEEYLQQLNEAMHQAVESFGKPDLLMYVAGLDLYGQDKLSRTNVTMEGIRARDRMVYDYFGSMGVPIAVSVPQGYAINIKDARELIKNVVRDAKEAYKRYYAK